MEWNRILEGTETFKPNSLWRHKDLIEEDSFLFRADLAAAAAAAYDDDDCDAEGEEEQNECILKLWKQYPRHVHH